MDVWGFLAGAAVSVISVILGGVIAIASRGDDKK